jgi:Uma2 family endonuclease
MTIAYSNIPDALPLDLSTLKLTDEQFYELCIANPEQPLELTAAGVLIVMSPVGGESGKREADLLVSCDDVLPGFELSLTNIL